MSLLPFEDAIATVLDAVKVTTSKEIRFLDNAVGYILAEDIKATFN